MKKIIALTAALLCMLSSMASTPFINYGKPARFIDLNGHLSVGGSGITQNYASAFPQISELAVNMGTAVGFGAGARLNFTDFLGLGCQVNFLINNYKTNTAVTDEAVTSLTNVFVKNHYYTLNFPVYVTFGFNLGSSVKWNVDAGAYYSRGLTGTSDATYYSAQVNPMGQLISTRVRQESKYYNSSASFIASSHRNDIGLHVGTGLTFMRTLMLGVSVQIGFKNVAHAYDAVIRPNVHNYNVLGTLGWQF